MHSVDLLEEAVRLAREVGFEVRREWLGEKLGGACRVAEQWILYSDLSLAADEQLRQVVDALRDSPLLPSEVRASPQLTRLLQRSVPR